jgi:hypothetical protein
MREGKPQSLEGTGKAGYPYVIVSNLRPLVDLLVHRRVEDVFFQLPCSGVRDRERRSTTQKGTVFSGALETVRRAMSSSLFCKFFATLFCELML